MRAAFSILFTCLINFSFGQKLSKEQVIHDLDILVNSIEKYNPALNDYNSDFSLKSRKILSSVSDSITIINHFSLISQICAFSNEGHFNLGNWEDDVHKGFLNNSYSYLPIKIKVISGEIFIINTYAENEKMKQFDKILSINGKLSAEILEKLFSHIPSDGHITSNLEHKVSSGFSWMYYLFVEQANSFDIEYESYNNNTEIKKTTIQAFTRAKQIENAKLKSLKNQQTQDIKKSIDDFYKLEINNKYANLTLKTFDHRLINQYKLEPNKLYSEIFAKIKDAGLENLIIDLRNNTGGRNEFADDMIPFILKTKPEKYLKKTISWKGKEKNYKFPKKNKLTYTGNIFVLTNGLTYSAGASLARHLKEYGNALIIGEETGTRYEGFAAGSAEYINLPNSNIKIGIPRYHIKYPTSQKQLTKNRGLIPDFILIEKISDIKEGNDISFKKVIEIINE